MPYGMPYGPRPPYMGMQPPRRPAPQGQRQQPQPQPQPKQQAQAQGQAK
jgi:hypothetical protein